MMEDALTHLRKIVVEIGGKRGELVLRVPPTGAELLLLPGPSAPETGAARLDCLSLIIDGFIESLDGEPLSTERAVAFAANPTSAAALLRLRAELYDDERYGGLIHLTCPQCGHDTGGIELFPVLLALHAKPWPIARPDGQPAEPSLASTFAPALGRRPPGIPVAAGARLELPSARHGHVPRPFSEAVLGPPLTVERDGQVWQRYLLTDRPFDPARAHWSFGNAGFRAIARMTVVLESLDGMHDLTPETIERLPMTDFSFIDLAHNLLHQADVVNAESATITCTACGQRFLMVL